MNNLRYALFPAMAAGILLASCNLAIGSTTTTTTTTSTTTTTLPPTPLQVSAEFNRSVYYDNTTQIDWYFDITYNGTPVSTATVMVNTTPVPGRQSFSYYYSLSSDESSAVTYVPGQTYTIRVTYGGTTYTEEMVLPGAITVSGDYRTVSWFYGGDFSVIGVDYTHGSGTYQIPGSTGPLSSPHAIPASAYPQSGQNYTLYANIRSYRSGFDTLRGSDSHVWCFDYVQKRFTT